MPQAVDVDLSELQRDPASQRGHRRRIAPLKPRAQRAILTDVDPHSRGARLGELSQPRGRLGDRARAEKTVHELNDRQMKFAKRGELSGVQA